MKLNLLVSLLVVACAAMLPSCKDDDMNVANEFTFAGDTYQLDQGYIEDYGSNGNGSYDFDLFITTENVQFNNASGEFEGTGEVIYLDLNSGISTGLEDGTYVFSSQRDAFTMVDGNVLIDYNLVTFSGQEYEVIGGTVKITSDGEQDIVEFDLTITNNLSVSGSFKGTFLPV